MKALYTGLVAATLVAGCGPMYGGMTPPEPPQSAYPREAYTLVNLHPDENRARLYSVNYQQAGLIPLCSRVTIHEATISGLTFTVQSTGRTYEYLFHRTLYESPEVHIGLYFGDRCQPPQNLSPVDMQGIREGKALPGMSKQAVILAIGYPPRHANPTLDADQWRYWKSRWNTILVHFQQGRVVRVQD